MATTATKNPTKKAGQAAAAPAAKKKAGQPAAGSAKASAGAAAAAPAEVPPDVREVPISALVKHPNNPRHRAIADTEMVESVRIHGVMQRLVVADFVSGGLVHGGKFTVIAGHRRLDAAKKAGRKTVPVEIRHDWRTEGQQLEAMLIENLHRQDLTPIEEAEGYHQLELFGYNQRSIAKAMGVSPDTVRSRLKLLKLSSTTIKKVQAGDLTLTDASHLVEFADDPEVTKDLERAAKSDPAEFKRALTSARRVRDARRLVATEAAKLLDRGATELPLTKGEYASSVYTEKVGRIEDTHSDNWDKHQGCLGFVRTDLSYSVPSVHVLCLDRPKHDKDTEAVRSAEEKKFRRENEARRAATEAASLKKTVASDMRIDTVMSAIADVATPATPVTDVVRYLLPILLRNLGDYYGDNKLTAYQRAMGITEADQWGRVRYSDAKKIDLTRFRQHIEEIRDSPATATRALVAYLAVVADELLGNESSVDHRLLLEYLDLLGALNHVGDPEVDAELRAGHESRLPENKGKATS